MDYLQEEYYATSSDPTTAPPQSQSHPHDLPDLNPSTPDQHTPYIPSNPDDPYDGMPPPPSGTTYPSLPALINSCQAHGRAHGYACVTASNNYKRGIAYVRCDRGGQYANHWNLTPETRQRHNRTRRLVGCAWKARAKRLKSGEWELVMMEDKHSGHGPSGDAKAHPSLRKLSDDAVQRARAMIEEGKMPKDVLEVLKAWNPDVTNQDVYNLKAKIGREKNGTVKVPKTGRRVGHVGEGQGQRGATDGTAAAAAAYGEQLGADQGHEQLLAVDPALQLQQATLGVGVGVGGPAPPAMMQDPSTGVDGSNDAADGMIMMMTEGAGGGVGGGSSTTVTGTGQKKCECKCCEH